MKYVHKLLEQVTPVSLLNQSTLFFLLLIHNGFLFSLGLSFVAFVLSLNFSYVTDSVKTKEVKVYTNETTIPELNKPFYTVFNDKVLTHLPKAVLCVKEGVYVSESEGFLDSSIIERICYDIQYRIQYLPRHGLTEVFKGSHHFQDFIQLVKYEDLIYSYDEALEKRNKVIMGRIQSEINKIDKI